MSETLVWWLMVQVAGLAALPLCLSLFRRLPDRGYALSKPFALIALGYTFWALNVMRILPNTTGGIVFVLLLLFAASALLLWRRAGELAQFGRERWWLIAGTEALFFLAFITAAYLRSYVPDLGGTEKPMDFMFLNAVTRGDRFPPPDPWLSGSNVSYYYFGYLIVSIMTRLSGLATSVGFNLGLAMIAALAVTAAFGLVYNLAAPREQREAAAAPGTAAAGFDRRVLWRPMTFGLAAGLLLAVMGNLGGLFEVLAGQNAGSSGFWSWVGIKDLSAYDSTQWFPDQFWFWWKSTRILDAGAGIHEFPFFSFLLGDLHPHVMSIPFVLLAAGVALSLLRSEEPLDLVVWLERPLWLIAFGVILGGLAFLNTWDLPTMAFVVTLMALLRNRLLAERWSWSLALDSAGFLAPLFFVAFLAYTPFFFGGFDSQARGFTAEEGTGSGLFHALIIWGPFAALILPYAVWRLSRNGRRVTWQAALAALAPAAFLLLLWVVWDILAKVLGFLPASVQLNEARDSLGPRIGERGWNWLTVLAMAGALGLLLLALYHEVEGKRDDEERTRHVYALGLAATAALLIFGTEFIYIEDGFDSRLNTIFKLYYQSWLLLSVAGGLALYELARGWRAVAPAEAPAPIGNWSFTGLTVAGLAIAGAVLGIFIGNDIFTSLVSAAIMGGLFFTVTAAAVVAWKAAAPEPEAAGPHGTLSWRAVWAGAAAVVLIGAFVYPLIATWNRTEGCVGRPARFLEANANCDDIFARRTIDGLKNISPDERAAIAWLAARDGQPVIAEALGDDYSDGGRFSASTGLPTLLQWPGHELQWRGTSEPQTGRPEALTTLYTSRNLDEVKGVIEQYGIEFVIVGRTEREKYPGLVVPEMGEIFEPAQELGEVTIYRVKPGVLSEVTRE